MRSLRAAILGRVVAAVIPIVFGRADKGMGDRNWSVAQAGYRLLDGLHPGAIGISGLLLAIFLTAASYTDVRWRVIKNQQTYPAILLGLFLNCAVSALNVMGFPESNWIWIALGGIGLFPSILGGLLCFGGMCLQFILFGTGAGDVKLMAALGVYLGWYTGFEVWLCTMVLAAFFAIVILIFRVGYRSLFALLFESLGKSAMPLAMAIGTTGDRARTELKKRLPLAPFFLASTIIVLAIPVIFPGETFVELMMSLV